MPESILLYRFLNAAAALQTLERRSFRVGRISEFNDPFEWKLGITGIVPEGDALARDVLNSVVASLNAEFGVMCFSDTASDPVLWSHYADHHRGIALEVDYLMTESLYRVEYSDDRPTVDANRLVDKTAVMEYLTPIVRMMFVQKSSGWAYEKEYRVFTRLADCMERDGHYFRPIPPDFLKRVILGFRCAIELDDVRRLLTSVGLNDTIAVKARDCRESYKILC